MTIWRLVTANLVVWWQSSARLVGGRSKRNALGLLAAAGWVAWLVLASRGDTSGSELGADTDRRVFESLTVLMVSVGWMSSAIANLYVSARPVIDLVVAVMPVSPFQRALTDRLVPAVLAVVGSTLVLSPVIWPLVTSLRPEFALGCTAVTLIVMAAIGALLGQTAHLALVAAHQRLLASAGRRAIDERAAVVSSVIAIVVLCWSYRAISNGGRLTQPVGGLIAVARRAANGSVLAPLVLLPLLAAAAAIVALAARWATAGSVGQTADRSPTTLRSFTLEASPRAQLLRLEIALWSRDRFNRGTLVTLALGVATTTVAWALGADDGIVIVLVSTLATVAALTGASSYGSTRRWHWTYVTAGRPAAWVMPKLASIAVVWCALMLPITAVALITGAWTAHEIIPTAGLSAMPVLTVAIVGVAMPTSNQHSLQSLATLLASLGVSASTLPAVLSISVVEQRGWALVAVGVLLATVLVVTYLRTAESARSRPATVLA